jgi:ABC-type Fe3+ transport system substrate-binding protein
MSEPFFIANETGVYNYDLSSRNPDEWFTWMDVRVVASTGDRVILLQDGRILRASRGPSASIFELSFSIIRPQTAEEIAAATNRTGQEFPPGVGNITVGLIGYDEWSGSIARAVFNFKKTDPDFEIEIKNYGIGTDAFTKLDLDIASGNCPDVLLIGSGEKFWNYARLGLFQDLSPYLNDPDFELADYHENIFRAFEQDGEQYGIPLSFYINVLVGKETDLLGIDDWNLDDFIAFADRYPDSSLFYLRDLYEDESTPEKLAVLRRMLYFAGGNIVDWSAQDAVFQRDSFIKILEIANRFADARAKETRPVVDRISEGDIQLIPKMLLFIEEIHVDVAVFGEPFRYIGYPSEQSNGFMIVANPLMAMSSKCENTQTAGEFIRYMLSEEVQSSDLSCYPVRRSSLEKWFAAGGPERNNNTVFAINMVEGDWAAKLRDTTDEDLAMYYDVINRAEEAIIPDEQVRLIILEETPAYFNGQKSVEEVADIVGSRVGIYVEEMK